ncbi:MAG: leucine-rich repeat domain-containing protein [Clostridia bacterium]|nr:leucine-rich repeat domain-containing protein [Clostridia bacterium]
MKKKALITIFMLVSVIFALAISSSALTLQESVNIYEGYFNGKTVETIDEIEASDHINPKIYASYASTVVNARVELSCSCGSTHVYPTYYITKFYEADTQWGHDHGTLYANEIFNISFDDINEKNPCNATYDKNSVIAIEIPDGYKVIDGGCTQTNCQSYMSGLRDSTSLKFVDMTTCTTVTRLDATSYHEAFGNCYALEYVKLADSVTEIGGWAFDECSSLKRVVISENSKLQTIKTKSFFACTSLEAFYLPDSILTITGQSASNEGAFVKCTSLYFVNSPNELTRSEAYYFPENLKNVEYEAFKNCNSINKYLVFGENVTRITGSWTFATNAEGIARTPETAITVVFLGNMTEFAFSNEMNYVSVVFANPNQGDIKFTINGPNGYTNTGAYIYKCNEGTRSPIAKNLSFTADGFAHLEDVRKAVITKEPNCVDNAWKNTYCFCGEYMGEVEIENSNNGGTHDLENATVVSVTYANFGMAGSKTLKCVRCGVEDIIEEAPALFVCLGHSAPENGTGGIAVGFTVNNKAITEYKEVTGKALKYGVFAVLKDRLGNNDIFGKDGTAAEGVISAEITNYEFVAFEIKIVGFTDEYKDTKLAMGTYVSVTDGEATEYSYIQSGTPNENEKYCFVSYNDFAEKPSTSEEVTQ